MEKTIFVLFIVQTLVGCHMRNEKSNTAIEGRSPAAPFCGTGVMDEQSTRTDYAELAKARATELNVALQIVQKNQQLSPVDRVIVEDAIRDSSKLLESFEKELRRALPRNAETQPIDSK